MITSFTAKHFRNLNIDSLMLNKINIFIGPNNSGKSNFVDAISFFASLISSSNNSLYPTSFWNQLNERGWSELLDRRQSKPNVIELNWKLASKSKHNPDLSYDLKFQIPDESDDMPEQYRISFEQLCNVKPFKDEKQPFRFFTCHDKKSGEGWFSVRELMSSKNAKVKSKASQLKLDVSPYETVLNQLQQLLASEQFRVNSYPNFIKAVTPVKHFFEGFKAYSSTTFDLGRIRKGLTNKLYLKELMQDGSNFVDLLHSIVKIHPDFLEDYTRKVREVIHDLQNITLEKIDDEKQKRLVLTIGGTEYGLSEMSDGTIKIMLIALLVTIPFRMSLLSMDEPELNLHPAWLRVMARWIARADSCDQIIITTHSPDFLDGLTEMFMHGDANLFIFNLQDESMIKQIPPEQVKHLVDGGWELGDIYRVGDPSLGGWPW